MHNTMIPREEIISMAREAGFNATVGKTTNGKYHPNVSAISKSIPVEWVERFAVLVESRVASTDAERYRWLKDGMRGQVPLVRIQVCKRGYTLVSAEDLDAVIDESIRSRSAA